MANNSRKETNKIAVIVIVILIFGIFGMIDNVSGSTQKDVNVETDSENIEVTIDIGPTRGTRSLKTTISDYLELCYSNGNAHEGVYGDENDGNKYYLQSQYYFGIYLKNIYDGKYLVDVNTSLTHGTTASEMIEIRAPSSNEFSMYPDNVDYFSYEIKFGKNSEMTKFDFTIIVNFKTVDDDYTRHAQSGTINIQIKVSSRIRSSGVGDKLKLVAVDKYDNIIPLYSGSRNQLITLPDIYSGQGTIDDVAITLNLPSNFKLGGTKALIEELVPYYYSNNEPQWDLTETGSFLEKADERKGTCSISYTFGQTKITEVKIPISIEIAKTPILSINDQIPEWDIGALTNDKYLSNIEIYQGSTTQAFTLSFKNTGNLDLKDVEVELFTDNAAFFFKSKFYYDENDQASKIAYGKTIKLGDISKDQVSTQGFSTAVIKNLPPGLYKIPIRYWAKYDGGEYLDVGFDVDDYHERITAARSEKGEGYMPSLIVNVLEGEDQNDNNEPDIQATTDAVFQRGEHNVMLNVELTNMENYRLKNVNVKIDAGEGSPLQPLNEMDRESTTIDALEKDFTMYGANDPIFSDKHTIHFLVDIYKAAPMGAQEVTITITCFDSFNQEKVTISKLLLSINPIPPRFIISDISTTDIKPNTDFTLKVKIFNCGGSDAQNVRVMFNGSTNLFSADENVRSITSIGKNKEAEFEFKNEIPHPKGHGISWVI